MSSLTDAARAVVAAVPVAHLTRAIEWYSVLFDRPPDAQATRTLAEWHLVVDGGFTVLQVIQDAERSGGGLVSIVVDDLGSVERGLAQHGLDAAAHHHSDTSLFVRIEDPFGNSLTLVQS